MKQIRQIHTEPSDDSGCHNATQGGYPARLVTVFRGIWRAGHWLRFQNIRRRYLWYFLAFPFAMTFVNVQEILFHSDVTLGGMDAETLVFSAYCIGAGLMYALAGVRNIAPAARISGTLAAAGLIPWLFLSDNPVGLIFATLFMLGMGGGVACASFAYAFMLNNTERFWGTILISFFYALIRLGSGTSFLPSFISKALFVFLASGTVACLIRFQYPHFSTLLEKPKAKWSPAISLTLYFFIVSYALDYFYGYLPYSSGSDTAILQGAFGLAAVALAILLQMLTKRSIWHMCNLFFVFMLGIIGCYSLYVAIGNSFWREAGASIHGLQQIGYTVTFYFLGRVFKKHGDFRLFKLSLAVVVLGSVLTYILPDFLSQYAPKALLPAAVILSGLAFMVFLLLSPAYAKHLFDAHWSDDFMYPDMTEARSKVERYDRIENLKLTPREKETALCLLQGKNSKEIAGSLNISVNTANFHIKNLYKKAGVSGRLELFARFGFPAQGDVNTDMSVSADEVN